MKYEGLDLLARLADEYVIGTLRGRARRRFERVIDANNVARSAVHRVEDQMLEVSLAIAPIQPVPATWTAIAGRIGIDAAPQRRREPPKRATWRMALAAAVAMLAIGIAWLVIDRTAPPTAVANLATEGGAPLWTVTTRVDRARLSVQATGPIKPEPGRSYELWALPEGGVPVSLGLMPEDGRLQRELTAAQLDALRASAKVAVSLEPEGGSQTGAPTGPVLFVANLQKPPTPS